MFGFDLPQVGAAITISAIAADATGYVHFIRNINDLLDLYKPAAVMSAIILSRNSLIEVILRSGTRVICPDLRRDTSMTSSREACSNYGEAVQSNVFYVMPIASAATGAPNRSEQVF